VEFCFKETQYFVILMRLTICHHSCKSMKRQKNTRSAKLVAESLTSKSDNLCSLSCVSKLCEQ
jgi:hypothetical protein